MPTESGSRVFQMYSDDDDDDDDDNNNVRNSNDN
jgi:hypothetical protein